MIKPIRLFKQKTNFAFMSKRWIGFGASIVLTLASLFLLTTQGLKLGIDFTGGVLMEIQTEQSTQLAPLRKALDGQGFGEISLQHFGADNEIMIRIQTREGEEQSEVIALVKEKIEAHFGFKPDYRKIDYVGPAVGSELIEAGFTATFLAFAAIMAYIWFRFEWQFGVGAILALLHDSIMMLGFFAITGFDFGLPAVAAILTIIGYSINDSVVIYDRVRENMRRYKKMPMEELLNISINNTLSRTILTALTTLLAALCLALFGGEVIKGFSWALVFGVAVGTYSSIYIAAPTLIYLNIRKESSPADAGVV